MICRAGLLVVVVVLGAVCMAAAQEIGPTTIEVALPADAQLWVNGRLTKSSGELREFRDSQARGGVYRYVLRAVAQRGGREVTQRRVLRLAAGQSARVAFDLPARTTSLKAVQPPVDALAQLQPRNFQESELPESPAIDSPADDGFRPRAADLSDPAGSDAATQDTEPEFPDLSLPTDPPRFGQPLDDEPDVDAPPTGDDLFPPDEPAAVPPEMEPSVGVDDAGKATLPQANWTAYIGQGHEHHLTGDTGTALHVWRGAWRMVRLERASADAGPYLIYNEVGHHGFDWAYGQTASGCDRCPVYFKPGDGARWRLVGHAQRVRPFAN
jgi:uncharacterized protein (TIGR03000 family)